MAANALTDREQEVTRLVLQRASTTEVAEQLTLSPHAVSQHLILFEKSGRARPVRARWQGALQPLPELRLRDRRTARPSRGGP